MRITLTPEEARIAQWLGKQRHYHDRKNNIKDTQVGGGDKIFIDINGMGGELAFCKLFNFYPDLTIAVQSGTFDCRDSLGQTYDVKTTHHKNGQLIAPPSKAKANTDRYVLMIGELPTYEYIGCVRAKQLFGQTNLKDFGYGLTYGMSQEQVRQSAILL